MRFFFFGTGDWRLTRKTSVISLVFLWFFLWLFCCEVFPSSAEDPAGKKSLIFTQTGHVMWTCYVSKRHFGPKRVLSLNRFPLRIETSRRRGPKLTQTLTKVYIFPNEEARELKRDISVLHCIFKPRRSLVGSGQVSRWCSSTLLAEERKRLLHLFTQSVLIWKKGEKVPHWKSHHI